MQCSRHSAIANYLAFQIPPGYNRVGSRGCLHLLSKGTRMKSLCCLAALWAAMCLGNASVTWGQAANGANKAWQVRYHKTNGNPRSNDIAMRLKIRAGTGNQLTATLTRYDHTMGGGMSEKYVKRSGSAGQIELTGLITNNPGGGNARKREDFVLAGVYLDSAGVPSVVTVRGFHYTGKDKSQRADDQLCVRIIDRNLLGFAAVAPAPGGIVPAPAPGEPCDEQPPDEDVLTEEDVPDMSPSDPDYDGGP
jgi:hypothetical protein